MKPEEQRSLLEQYGADVVGIDSRFLADMDFYAQCLGQFVKDTALDALRNALASFEYGAAFEAAHNLKGSSANMGLTPLYDADCLLVEALRVGGIDSLDALLDRVVMEFDRVKELAKTLL